MDGRLLTARTVSELLGVHVETVLCWVRRGDLPALRLPGGAIRFRPEELEGWISGRSTLGQESSTMVLDAARRTRRPFIVATPAIARHRDEESLDEEH